MIFNCTSCGVSISTNKKNCPYCRIDNSECIEMLTGIRNKADKVQIKEKLRGSIFSFVHR